MQDLADSVAIGTGLVLSTNALINTYLSGALNKLLSVINNLQNVTHMPIFAGVRFPFAPKELNSALSDIVNFQLIDLDDEIE